MSFRSWVLIGMLLSFCDPSSAAGFLELRLAYLSSKADCSSVVFANDRLPRSVVAEPLLTEQSFESARIVDGGADFGKVAEVVLTEAALTEFNKAARSNERPGLGLFVDGKPVTLFQSIFPLDEPVMWLIGMSEVDMNTLLQVLATET